MRGGELELLGPRPLPLPHRCDDPQIGGEGLKRDVKSDLVVSLAGAAMRHGRGAMLARHADHELSDQWSPQRRGQRVLTLVEGPGHQRRPDEVIDEKVARVLGDGVDRPGAQRLLANRLDILALTQVAGVGDHVHVVRFVDPLDGNRRVKAAAIRQYELVACHGILSLAGWNGRPVDSSMTDKSFFGWSQDSWFRAKTFLRQSNPSLPLATSVPTLMRISLVLIRLMLIERSASAPNMRVATPV